MLRVDRNVRFGEDSLRIHVDRNALFRPEALILLHADPAARFQTEFMNLIHVDSAARFREVVVTLHIERSAQFRGERAGGIFSKKIYCFYVKVRTGGFGYVRSLTKEHFRSLIRQQKGEPVPIATERESGITWWMFQGQFFWEDYSAQEVDKKSRSLNAVLMEVIAAFSAKSSNITEISRNIYHFHCQPKEQERLQGEFLTEEQYKTLLAQQQDIPLQVLSSSESGRTWWMFQDKTYWADADLTEDEVKLLFFEGARSQTGISRETKYRFLYNRRGRSEVLSNRVWTEEQYQTLLTRQHEGPVQLLNDGSKTFWMFQDRFYWAHNNLAEKDIIELFLEGTKSLTGISRESIYHFHTKQGNGGVQSGRFWTQEQYRSLLARQRQEPIRLVVNDGSATTWWMFQDKFYWEDFSTGWPKETMELEMLKHFYKGSRGSDDISRKIFRSKCKQGGREFQAKGFWTEEQYQILLVKQKEDPVLVLRILESGRAWWMFRDKFYWEDEDLKEIEVKALLLEKIRKKERQIERAMRSMEQESRLHTRTELIPDQVKSQVWRRDGGCCAICNVYCGREEDSVYVQIVPHSQGGRTTVDNIQLLCDMCNVPF